MSPLPRPRAALIGVSGYGKIYLERVLHHATTGELTLVAATVINRAEEAAACRELTARGCTIYGDYKEMLAAHHGELDLVLIPTGIHWHARMTRAALAAGAHVLVEKPLAATIEDVRAIQRDERATGRFVAVGFQDIYLADTAAVKKKLAEDYIGKVRRIRSRGLWPRPAAYYARNDWAGRVRLGEEWVLDSPLANALAHFLNLALFVAGDTPTTSARPIELEAETYRARPIESYDTVAVRLTTHNGVTVCFYATHSCTAVIEPELILEGDAGRGTWSAEAGWCLERHDGASIRFPPRGETQARKEMFERVLRRLRDPQGFVCDTEIAAQHTLCVNGVRESGPVHDIAPAYITVHGADRGGAAQVSIADIESHFARAYVEGALPSEIGCPWAVPAGRATIAELAGTGEPASAANSGSRVGT